MKNLVIVILASIFIGSLINNIAFANERTSSFSFKKLSNSLCESAESDSVYQFRRVLRASKHHIRTIYLDVDCGGQSLLSVATSSHSDSVINYLKLKAQPESVITPTKSASAK